MRTLTFAAVALLAAAAQALAQGAAPPDAVRDLAPTGKLRAAINFGNGVLAQKGPAGEPNGITPDLARALGQAARRAGRVRALRGGRQGVRGRQGRRLGYRLHRHRAGARRRHRVHRALRHHRGHLHGAQGFAAEEIADVDKPGIKVAVGVGSAYDLYLTRTLKNATLVRAKVGGGRAMIEMFVTDKLDAAAGVRQPLEAYAKDHPDMRVMAGHFQEIKQAMGMPKKNGKVGQAGAKYLAAFVEDMKASGFVADALKRSGQVAVKPASR